MWRAGRRAPRAIRTACSMPSWTILPNVTTVTEMRYDRRPPRAAIRTSKRQAEIAHVLVHQGGMDGRSLPPAPSFPTERPLPRAFARIAGAACHALSVGILLSGNRSRSRPAEQILV